MDVAAVWGAEFYSVPCRSCYFACDDFEEEDEFILFFHIILVQFILFIKSFQQGIVQILSPKQQRRPLPFLLYLTFFYDLN